MENPGKQYKNDDKTDPSGFLRRARLHQSIFRSKFLSKCYDTYGNYLTQDDGEKGKNFYEGFGIFDAVKEYSKDYNKPLYSNLLRSEHIPFNFFIPLDKNKLFAKSILKEILKRDIKSVDLIKTEYAPPNPEKYLNDRTSFDAYIEYTNADNSKGIIGIEVKYTEKEYKLLPNSKQEKDILNKDSAYYKISEKCGLYKKESINLLPTDKFRQVWRNHLLGESILIVDKDKFHHFTSLTLFPAANTHFVKTSKDYMELLKDNDNKFISLTYENFFSILKTHCPDDNYAEWIEYLNNRYIVCCD
jgi:hypothetical protein